MSFTGGSESASFDITVNTSGVESGATQAAEGLTRITESAKQAARGVDASASAMGRSLQNVAKQFRSAGQEAGSGFAAGATKGKEAFESLAKTLDALARTSAARIAQFEKSGLSGNLTALFRNEEERVLRLQHEIQDNQAKIIADPQVARAYQQQALGARKVLTQEGTQLLAIQTHTTAELNKAAASDTSKIQAQTAGQIQVAAAQEAGKRRVAITRGVVDTIGRLEKGLGATVAGIARTATGAVSKIFSGTVGTLQRSFSERRSVIERNLRSESHLFQEQSIQVQRLQASANRGIVGGISRNTIGFLGGGFAAIGAVRQIFTLGSQFATGLNVLQAQLGLTAEQMKTVSDLAIKLGNDVKLPGVSALDAAQAIGLLAKQFAALGAGALPAAEAAAKGALELSRATGATAEEAAGSIGAAVNVFHFAATQATDAADILASALAKSAGISFQNFKDAFTQASSVFAQFEVAAEGPRTALIDLATAEAVLAKRGIFGETAGAGLQQFFLQGTKGGKASANALKLVTQRAGETGTAFFTAQGRARPFAQTIDILRRGVAGFTQEQRNATFSVIFGARSIKVANALVDTSAVEYLKLAAAIGNSRGAAERFAAAQNRGVKGALDAIKSELETIAIEIFNKVNKPLGNAGLAVATFVGNVLTAGGAFAVVRKGLLGVAAGLGAVLAVKTGVQVLTLLAQALPLLITPFGALSVLAAGLGAAFLIAGKGSKSFSETVAKIKTAATGFLADAIVKVTQFGKTVATVFEAKVLPLLKEFGDLVKRNIQPGIDKLRELGQAVLRFIQPALVPLQNFIDTLRRAFDFAKLHQFSAALFELELGAKGLGTALLSGIKAIPFGTIAKALSTRLGQALTGAGIGAGVGGIVAGPLGAALGAGLGAAIVLAIPRIRAAIASIDVPSLFGKLLDGVHEVGRRIGLILSDKRTILAVAGIAAAAAALAVQFVTGFAQGIISNLGDIKAAGAKILESLFDQGSVTKSIIALAILVRTVLFTQFGRANIGKSVGALLGKQIADETANSVEKASLGTRLKTIFTSIGKDAGTAVAIGLSAALSGSALGTAKSGVEKGLGLAGIAGSAAAAFSAGTALSGGNLAVGASAAIASAAVSGFSAILSHNAEKSKEAKDRMLEFRDALNKTGGVGDVFQTRLAGASDKVIGSLVKAKVNVVDFQAALAAGKGRQFVDDLIKANSTLVDTRANGGGLANVLNQDVAPAVKFLQQQVTDLNRASQSKGLRDNLSGIAESGKRASDNLVPLKGHVEDLRVGLQLVNEEAKKQELQTQIDALKTKTQAAAQAAVTARQAFEQLLAPKPETAKTATQQGVIDLPSIASGVDQAVKDGVKSALGAAESAQSITQFQNDIRSALSKATSKEQFQGVFKDFSVAIGEAKISPAAKATFAKALGDLQKDPTTKAALAQLLTVNAKDTQAKASKLATDFLSSFSAKFGGLPPVDVAQKLQGVTTPQQAQKVIDDFTTQANNFARRGFIEPPPVKPDAKQARQAGVDMGNAVKEGASSVSLDGVGSALVDGLTTGITNNLQNARDATFILAHQVAQAARTGFAIKSPSKVFVAIGTDVTDGLVQGLKIGASDATAQAQSLADAVVNAALTAQQRLTQALSSGRAALFDSVFGGFDIAARTAVDDAKAGFTSGLSGIASSLDSAATSLFSAMAKKANERSLAERLLVGESQFSLNLGDELGVGNRAAIQAAVKSIEDIGTALLKQGASAATVSKTLQTYRAQLLAFTSGLGFNRAQVDALLNSLGLSTAAIQKFISNAATLTGIVNEAAGQAKSPTPATPPPLKTGPNPTQSFIFQAGAVQVNTGHDDPQALGLTLVNRIAAGIH